MKADNVRFKVCVTPDESEEIQKACFACGIAWQGSGNTAVASTDAEFLYIEEDGIGWGCDPVYFEDKDLLELHPQDAISLLRGFIEKNRSLGNLEPASSLDLGTLLDKAVMSIEQATRDLLPIKDEDLRRYHFLLFLDDHQKRAQAV